MRFTTPLSKAFMLVILLVHNQLGGGGGGGKGHGDVGVGENSV